MPIQRCLLNSMHKPLITSHKGRVIKTLLPKSMPCFRDSERSLMNMEIYKKSNVFKF